MEAKHYFESHVTIDPVFDNERDEVATIAVQHGFKLAKLLMQKRKEDTPEQSKHDTFMTGHGKQSGDITERTIALVKDLQAHKYKVRRYKIEDTVLDSRIDDEFGLLS